MTHHILGHNVSPARDMTEAEYREAQAQVLERRADILAILVESAALSLAFREATVAELRARAARLRTVNQFSALVRKP